MVIYPVCLFRNKWLPLHLKLNIMEAKTIKVILSEEAESFVRLQPVKAQQKITYNIRQELKKIETEQKQRQKQQQSRRKPRNQQRKKQKKVKGR